VEVVASCPEKLPSGGAGKLMIQGPHGLPVMGRWGRTREPTKSEEREQEVRRKHAYRLGRKGSLRHCSPQAAACVWSVYLETWPELGGLSQPVPASVLVGLQKSKKVPRRRKSGGGGPAELCIKSTKRSANTSCLHSMLMRAPSFRLCEVSPSRWTRGEAAVAAVAAEAAPSWQRHENALFPLSARRSFLKPGFGPI
jgi:hypothetical protein